MYPTLLSIGMFHFHAYTVMMALAFLVGVLASVRENYKLETPYPVTPIIGIWIFIGAMIGARAYWIVQYDDWRMIYRAILPWQGGLVFYGGLFGGVLGGMLYVRVQKVPVLRAMDIGLPYLPLAHAIARIGCFLNGCCWGAPTSLPWGVSYPRPSLALRWQAQHDLIAADAPRSLAVHPVQLYSVAGLLVIFVLMRWAYRRHVAGGRVQAGAVATLYPLFYGILRFCTEFFRGDSAHGSLGLTTSQWVALAFMALGLAGVCVIHVVKRSTKAPEATAAAGARERETEK